SVAARGSAFSCGEHPATNDAEAKQPITSSQCRDMTHLRPVRLLNGCCVPRARPLMLLLPCPARKRKSPFSRPTAALSPATPLGLHWRRRPGPSRGGCREQTEVGAAARRGCRRRSLGRLGAFAP